MEDSCFLWQKPTSEECDLPPTIPDNLKNAILNAPRLMAKELVERGNSDWVQIYATRVFEIVGYFKFAEMKGQLCEIDHTNGSRNIANLIKALEETRFNPTLPEKLEFPPGTKLYEAVCVNGEKTLSSFTPERRKKLGENTCFSSIDKLSLEHKRALVAQLNIFANKTPEYAPLTHSSDSG